MGAFVKWKATVAPAADDDDDDDDDEGGDDDIDGVGWGKSQTVRPLDCTRRDLRGQRMAALFSACHNPWET